MSQLTSPKNDNREFQYPVMDFGITPSRNHYELGQDPVSAHPTEESMLASTRLTNDLINSRPKVFELDQSVAKKNLNPEFAKILPLYGA